MSVNFKVKIPFLSWMLALRLGQQREENLCRVVEILTRKNAVGDCYRIRRVFHYSDRVVLIPGSPTRKPNHDTVAPGGGISRPQNCHLIRGTQVQRKSISCVSNCSTWNITSDKVSVHNITICKLFKISVDHVVWFGNLSMHKRFATTKLCPRPIVNLILPSNPHLCPLLLPPKEDPSRYSRWGMRRCIRRNTVGRGLGA